MLIERRTNIPYSHTYGLVCGTVHAATDDFVYRARSTQMRHRQNALAIVSDVSGSGRRAGFSFFTCCSIPCFQRQKFFFLFCFLATVFVFRSDGGCRVVFARYTIARNFDDRFSRLETVGAATIAISSWCVCVMDVAFAWHRHCRRVDRPRGPTCTRSLIIIIAAFNCCPICVPNNQR